MNVILILTDQLSAKWVGCYGNPAASTPNLDAMAAQGARFNQCFVNHPVCMPSRASIMTGRSAQHHGVFQNGYELGLDLPTFPQVLQQAGVQTFGVGKFHLECHGRSAYNDVLKYGFDCAEVTEDHRAGDWLDWVEETFPQHYERALATVWGMPHMAEYGPRKRNLLEEVRQARAKHPPELRALLTYPSIVPEEACQTHWAVDRALAFINGRDPSRPFFLKLSFVDPHDPYDPPERFLDRIDPERIPARVVSEDPALCQALERFGELSFVQRFGGLSEVDWLVRRRHYLASLAFIDEQVGRLLQHLAATGLDEDTVVIFSADHGDMIGDHGIPAKGGWHFDACIRVPLIVMGPGVSPRVADRVVTTLDLFPTITDFAGIADDTPVEGASLRPLLRGQGDPDRPDAALVESYQSYTGYERRWRARTARTAHAAFTLFGDGGGMLFDLTSDPDETVNLFDRPDAEALRSEMTRLLLELEWLRFDPLPRKNKHPTALH